MIVTAKDFIKYTVIAKTINKVQKNALRLAVISLVFTNTSFKKVNSINQLLKALFPKWWRLTLLSIYTIVNPVTNQGGGTDTSLTFLNKSVKSGFL